MKVIHLRKPHRMDGVCYCGKPMKDEIPWMANSDVTKTTCKGAMRVIKAAWAKLENHEARLKK